MKRILWEEKLIGTPCDALLCPAGKLPLLKLLIPLRDLTRGYTLSVPTECCGLRVTSWDLECPVTCDILLNSRSVRVSQVCVWPCRKWLAADLQRIPLSHKRVPGVQIYRNFLRSCIRDYDESIGEDIFGGSEPLKKGLILICRISPKQKESR